MNESFTFYRGLPRFPLAFLPTPVHELKRLSAALRGPRILIKRDDQTGLCSGGNKTRKLEFLIADALQQKADMVITAGAVQSNHCRQTAAAAVLAGLPCELVLSGTPPEIPNGNHLLDLFLGARLHFADRPQRNQRMLQVVEERLAQGKRPYIIPIGGSTGLGALGYCLAMEELNEQLQAAGEKVDIIITASSSGGTQAGLALGARLCGFTGRVLGISIDNDKLDGAPFQTELSKIADDACRRLGLSIHFEPDEFHVQYDYLGQGYGVVGALEAKAIALVGCTEGLLLDPVYTGRAFGGLLDLIRKKVFTSSQTILFWHTGGSAALFAYAAELEQRIHGLRAELVA
ncbi:MAG TPA: D-cysteine desulfhydrase family protein [bacterium]|nr:D-cysteine desulfhydrase family protein [bacterium]